MPIVRCLALPRFELPDLDRPPILLLLLLLLLLFRPTVRPFDRLKGKEVEKKVPETLFHSFPQPTATPDTPISQQQVDNLVGKDQVPPDPVRPL